MVLKSARRLLKVFFRCLALLSVMSVNSNTLRTPGTVRVADTDGKEGSSGGTNSGKKPLSLKLEPVVVCKVSFIYWTSGNKWARSADIELLPTCEVGERNERAGKKTQTGSGRYECQQ